MKMLTKNEKFYFDNFVDSLTNEDKQNNICEECGKISDVFNPKIVEEIFNKNIKPIEYWESGCKRIIDIR